MFCPNCGNDCGNDKFCTACQASVSQPNAQTEAKSYTIPCGLYKGVSSALTLYDEACVLCTTGVGFKKYETRIPYDKITAVVYERPLYKATSLGHLLIRWEGNRDLPIPAPNRFSVDQTTVTTATGIDTIFYHIFYMLKALAPATASFDMIIPDAKIPGVEELMQKVDAQAYFDKYAPYRDKAVEEMRRETGATLEQAKETINRIFDARQKPIYDADPMAAISDLNRLANKQLYAKEQIAKVFHYADKGAKEKTCPYCGGPLPDNCRRTPNYYFLHYYPNRVKAVKALRKDSPMSIREATRQIDEIFDAYKGTSPACKTEQSCPECGAAMALDLAPYYHTYKLDRAKAVEALCQDTGMDTDSAQVQINRAFDYYKAAEHRHIQMYGGQGSDMQCPRCGCNTVFTQELHIRSKNAILGWLIKNPLLRLMYVVSCLRISIKKSLNAGRLNHLCSNCGLEWHTRKK